MSLILADAGSAGISLRGPHALRAAGKTRRDWMQPPRQRKRLRSRSNTAKWRALHIALLSWEAIARGPSRRSLACTKLLPPQEGKANTMFGLPNSNRVSLRAAARELKAAPRWIGDQTRWMIVILDTEGGHIGAEIMRQHDMRNADTSGAQDGTHDANSLLDTAHDTAWRSLGGGAGEPPMRSARELQADEGFRAALSQNGVSWAHEVSLASDKIHHTYGALREIADHYRLETEALAAQIRETCDSASLLPFASNTNGTQPRSWTSAGHCRQ